MHCMGVGKASVALLPPEELEALIAQVGLQRYTAATITDADAPREHLAHVRSVGYAVHEGEHEAEVRCVAAPILNRDLHRVASISISTPAYRYDPDRLASWTAMIVASAQGSSRDIGMAERA